jgi:disulfide bond formation protein DsbB
MTQFQKARALALFVPGALMAGALGSQYIGHLYPCEYCHWQRWPHYTAIVLALLAFALRGNGFARVLTILAGLAILTSGVIGVYHAGVEYHWWDGLSTCSTTVGVEATLESILKAPLIRCDVAQWTFHGISLAGFNALFSIFGALAVFAFLAREEKM